MRVDNTHLLLIIREAVARENVYTNLKPQGIIVRLTIVKNMYANSFIT